MNQPRLAPRVDTRGSARRPWRMAVAGLALVLLAAYVSADRIAFLRAAQRVDGLVVDMDASRGEEPTWRPIVRYTDAHGTHVEAMGWRTDPPLFELGERVGVWVRLQPREVRPDAAFALWGMPALFAAIGLPLLLWGGKRFARHALAERLRARLRRSGTVVVARIEGVEHGGGVQRGQPTRVIVATWTDPATGTVHALRSEELAFDPTPWSKRGSEIFVFIDPRDPRRHALDLSFLPRTPP
jgi:hypothetical protein